MRRNEPLAWWPAPIAASMVRPCTKAMYRAVKPGKRTNYLKLQCTVTLNQAVSGERVMARHRGVISGVNRAITSPLSFDCPPCFCQCPREHLDRMLCESATRSSDCCDVTSSQLQLDQTDLQNALRHYLKKLKIRFSVWYLTRFHQRARPNNRKKRGPVNFSEIHHPWTSGTQFSQVKGKFLFYNR